jgi:Zn-dependent protease
VAVQPDNIVARIIVALPAFLLAIILHEVAHGYVAYLCGDDTAKRAGRLTLSPLPHIDPVGAIFFIFSSIAGAGFGWAKPVPVAIHLLRNPRRDEVLVTLAGPVANLLQIVAWAMLARLSLHLLSGDLRVAFFQFCVIGVQINALLMVFNLLPIPPLDGSHVAARLLGVEDPHLVDRLAPIGFLVLFLLISTRIFDLIYRAVVVPLILLFLP